MKNRTQEQLKAMFEQYRHEQEKKKLKKQQQTLQLRQALYKKADIIIKKAFQEEKKKRLEQLQLLMKQKPKEEVKIQRTLPLHIYGQMIERDTNEEELYTLDELKNIEELYPNEIGRIRWDVWDKLIEKTQKELKHYEETNSNLRI